MPYSLSDITGLTTFYRTPNLIQVSLDPVRGYYPSLPLVIVDNSVDDNNDIKRWTADNNAMLFETKQNLGHGPGLNRGMNLVETKLVYIFDSDTEIIRENMLEEMLKLVTPETYGMGFIRNTSIGGAHVTPQTGQPPEGGMRYLHPLSCLVQVNQYKKYRPFNSGGAPFANAMEDIHNTGKADKMLISFPVLIFDESFKFNFVKHHSGSTRARYGICSSYTGV